MPPPQSNRRTLQIGPALLLSATVAAMWTGCGTKPTETPPDRNEPVVVQVTGLEATHRFGYVEPETKHFVRFRLRNNADAALQITRAMSDCPCIRILESPTSIPPGGAGDVFVEYESSERREHYTGQVIVMTDRSEATPMRLQVLATVGLSLEVIPNPLQVQAIRMDEERDSSFRIVNHGDQPVRITHGSSDHPQCRVSVPQVAVPPGQAVRVPITLRGDTSPGDRVAEITIASDSAYQPSVQATVRWRVAAD